MSYISVSGVSSYFSSQDTPNAVNGSNIPVGAVVSGTTYTALSWTLGSDGGSNGRGTYAYVYKFALDGDNTTAFQEVIVNFVVNGGVVYSNEVLVGATLPDANPHSFTIPFIFNHDLAITDIITITITPTISAGTLPTIPVSNTNIYKIA
jgi:hypothetical protein